MEVLLRNVIESDLQTFYTHQADPVANQMAGFPARELDSFMAHWTRIRADESNILRTILYSRQVAGNIVSFMMEGKREIGYWIGREFWGKGIATKALELFLEEVEIRPLYGVALRSNIGSQRVLSKCGFAVVAKDAEEVVFVLESIQ